MHMDVDPSVICEANQIYYSMILVEQEVPDDPIIRMKLRCYRENIKGDSK